MANTIKLGNGNWATKEGSLLAYNDENNNFKPLPFTTTRASSASVVNKQGLIETVGSGIPRIDFSDDANGALLLEPTATNSILYSEDFSNAAWTTLASGETVAINSVISPDGTLNADTLEGDGTATNVYLRNDITLSTSVDYTFSIFAKKGTNDFLAISAAGFTGSTNTDVTFDLNNSVVTGGIGNIENYGNGWLKCSYTIAISTDGVGRFLIYSSYSGTVKSFPTSADAIGKNIYLFGASLEENSYASSYIKTVGTTQTRVADTANGAGNSTVINSSEGVLYAEMKNDIVQNQTISLRQGTTDSVQLGLINGNIRCAIVSNNSAVLDTSTFAYNNGLINKYAIVWNGTNAKTFINGQLTNTITTPSPLNLDSLDFQNPALAENIVGKIKSVQVYTTALSDAELTSLTTI